MLYLILIGIAATLFTFGILIYSGNTNLILSFHHSRVVDKKSYGEKIGKILFFISGITLISGLISLLPGIPGKLPHYILFAGYGLAFIQFYKVQSVYNGGIF